MDITNKRLRDNEYIASLMTNELSKSLYRIMNKVENCFQVDKTDISLEKYANNYLLRR